MIVIIQPCKKKHDTVITSLILANLALIFACHNANEDAFSLQTYFIIGKIATFLPAAGLLIFILYKLFHKPCQRILRKLSMCKSYLCFCIMPESNHMDNVQHEMNAHGEAEQDLPHRLEHPNQYIHENSAAY